MSTLESLVPPVELCKQIPAGRFADSVLVSDILHEQETPHTLEELIQNLQQDPRVHIFSLDMSKKENCYYAYAMYSHPTGAGQVSLDINAETPLLAVLTLWMKINGVKEK